MGLGPGDLRILKDTRMDLKGRTMNSKTLAVGLIITLLLLAGSGCRSRRTELSLDSAASDEALFKLGQDSLKRDPERARIYFRQVIDSFPKSIFAERAKLAIADSYFNKKEEGNLIMAAAEYREFINLYPLSPSVAYAQYQVAMTYYSGILKPGRDQTKTQQALVEFKRVVANYPLSEESKNAQTYIKDCEERLAAHELGIARHYHKVYAFSASTTRLLGILTEYPAFSEMEEVYYYLADSYYLWGQAEKSVPFFTKVISDYPQSKLAKKAQERLNEIKARPKEKK